MQHEIATLRDQLAEVQSLRHAEAAVRDYLASQPEAIKEDRIHAAVAARRATLQRALRQAVEDGKVKRIGRGIKGNPYRYVVLENPNPKNEGSVEPQSVNPGTGPC